MAAPERDALVEALFAEHYAPLCRLAALLVDARAEELVMDAFAATLTGWRRIRDLDAAPAYLRRAVVNRCRTAMTRAGTETRANARAFARANTTALPVEPDGTVMAAVVQLPPRQRAAIVLTYFADLSTDDVAAAMGCAPGTVKSQLAKARATLARLLEEDRHG